MGTGLHHSPLSGRRLVSRGNRRHWSGISANVFFPRELITLGLWFLTQRFREILEYTVTEPYTKLREKLYRFKRKGMSTGVNSCLVPLPFLCLFTVCLFSTSVSG